MFYWTLFLSLLCSWSVLAQDRGIPPVASDALGFAEHLFLEGDHYRAITEYKRYLFRRPKSAIAPWVRMRIGESYLLGQRYAAALAVFEDLQKQSAKAQIKRSAMLAGARALYLDKRYVQALLRLDVLRMSEASQELAGMGRYLEACIRLRQGDVERAREALGYLTPEHSLGPNALTLLGIMDKADALPHKRPWLAGLLSVVPGLGHFYLEQYSIGLTAFVWNGIFGVATYEAFRREQYGVGALLACLELLWYSGTMYGAVSGAHRYNRDAWVNYLEDMEPHPGLDIPHPNSRNLGLFLKGAY